MKTSIREASIFEFHIPPMKDLFSNLLQGCSQKVVDDFHVRLKKKDACLPFSD